MSDPGSYCWMFSFWLLKQDPYYVKWNIFYYRCTFLHETCVKLRSGLYLILYNCTFIYAIYTIPILTELAFCVTN